MRRRLLVGIVIATGVVLTGGPAHGDAEGTGGFCIGELGLCAGIETKPAPREPERRGGPIRRRGPSPVYWIVTEFHSVTCTDSPDAYGIMYTLVDRASGEMLLRRGGCIKPVAGQSVPDTPPLPEEVWERVPLPVPEIRVNPPAAGLTGLETWFWYDQPTNARLDVNLGGFSVTINAEAIGFRWRTGDGTELTSGTPGSAEAPAARHVYETKGEYRVALDVSWTGTYTFSGPGLQPIEVPLGERTFSGAARFSVAEIWGVRQ